MSSKLQPILIRLFFILLFISATSVAYVLLPDDSTKILQQINTTTTPNLILQLQAEESFIKASAGTNQGHFSASPTDQNDNTHIPTSSSENFQTATIIVGEQTYNLQFKHGESLLVAMRRLSTSSITPFLFSGHEYPALGFFVEEINNIKNNPGENKYWIYYINGQSATMGISNYILKSNDIIKWKYEKSTF